MKESILINAQGDINAFTFTDAKVDSKVPDDTFKWTAPRSGSGSSKGPNPASNALTVGDISCAQDEAHRYWLG